MSCFVDWVTIKQRHELNSLPVVSDGIITATDANLTELHWDSIRHKQLEGSFDTALRVRCDGTEVFLSGNVGRFGRPDNVFNLDFEDTITKANKVLDKLGLPPFTAGEQIINPNPSEHDMKHGLFDAWTGATLSNIHLTSNYSTGSGYFAKEAINWLAGQSVSRVRRGIAGESTVFWGSKGGRKYLKAYIKSLEMLAHVGAAARPSLAADQLFQWVNAVGMVRVEFEAHRLLLRDNGLRYLGDIDMGKLIKLFNAETEVLNRVSVDEQALTLEHIPSPYRGSAALYLKGQDLRQILERRTFFRHAKFLRGYGLDIGEPRNVQQFPTVLRVIDMQPVQAPAWYWDRSRFVDLSLVAA